MKDLELCFNEAISELYSFVAVKIQMQGFEQPEIIINRFENFQAKLEYYKRAYNKDLTLKTNTGIKIIGFIYSDSFDEIEEQLVD
jgi:hypothetical protein